MAQQPPTVYVSNLPHSIRSPGRVEEVLTQLCDPIAKVTKVVALTRTQRTRGQAWVSFATVEDATKVIAACSGREVQGRKIVMAFAKAQSKVDVGKRSRDMMEERAESTPLVSLGGYGPGQIDAVERLLKTTMGFVGFLKDEKLAEYRTSQSAAEAVVSLHGVSLTLDGSMKLKASVLGKH